MNVSRAAVNDHLKRSVKIMQEYEKKLKLIQKYEKRMQIYAKIVLANENTIGEYIAKLEQLEND